MVANDNANFELMHNFDVKLIGFQLLKQPISLIDYLFLDRPIDLFRLLTLLHKSRLNLQTGRRL